jgi:hypothetical protein
MKRVFDMKAGTDIEDDELAMSWDPQRPLTARRIALEALHTSKEKAT